MNNLKADLRTSDLDEFREAVGKLLCPFSVIPHAKQYDARLHHRRFGGLSFIQITYDNPIDIDVPPIFPGFLVQVTLRGSFQVRTTGAPHLISAELAQLMPPHVPLKMHCPEGMDVLAININLSEFASACAQGDGDDRLLTKLPETLPLTGPGASLAHYIRFLHTESLRPDAQLGRKRTARHTEQMLYAFLLDLAEKKSWFAVPRQPWYIKRAEEFMEANLNNDIGIADIAVGASISMRALHYGFRKVYGVSPMVWLKQHRLDRVRADLIAANPFETTVTEVALRWGLVHLGRFAAEYRARFGELPSTTLYRR